MEERRRNIRSELDPPGNPFFNAKTSAMKPTIGGGPTILAWHEVLTLFHEIDREATNIAMKSQSPRCHVQLQCHHTLGG